MKDSHKDKAKSEAELQVLRQEELSREDVVQVVLGLHIVSAVGRDEELEVREDSPLQPIARCGGVGVCPNCKGSGSGLGSA